MNNKYTKNMQTNHNLGNKTLIGSLLLAAIILLLCSCGARKTDRSKSTSVETAQVEIVKVDSSKTVTVSDTNVKIVDLGTEEETIIEPIDNSKEMIVNGKVYKNAVLKHVKSKRNKVVEQSKTTEQTEQKAVKEVFKAQTHKEATIEMKKTESTASYWRLLWLLLLIPICYLYKKYKVYLPF